MNLNILTILHELFFSIKSYNMEIRFCVSAQDNNLLSYIISRVDNKKFLIYEKKNMKFSILSQITMASINKKTDKIVVNFPCL